MKLREALQARITAYLSGGGLFNPELANHDAVRDLLIECRDALAEPVADEPVAYLRFDGGMILAADAARNPQWFKDAWSSATPLYTRPAAQEPVADEPVFGRWCLQPDRCQWEAGGAGCRSCDETRSKGVPMRAPAPAERGEYPPLPDRLIRFTLRDLKAKREALNGFVAVGNELERAREYDQWILSLERYIETAQEGGAND